MTRQIERTLRSELHHAKVRRDAPEGRNPVFAMFANLTESAPPQPTLPSHDGRHHFVRN
jgi:hypothetical protein